MNIAFDVNGTLDGYRGDQVKQLCFALYKAGHSIFVWSNLHSYAVDMVKDLANRGIKAQPYTKYSSFEAKQQELTIMDVAFENDSTQTYLATKKLVLVSEIPEEPTKFNDFVVKMVKECQK